MTYSYNIFDNHVTEPSGIINYKFGKLEMDGKTELIMKVNSGTNMHAFLVQVANQHFRKSVSREAFIRAFYLYYLFSSFGQKEVSISVSDLVEILGVSSMTIKKINEVLWYYSLITINKNDWYRSRLLAMSNQVEEKYSPKYSFKYTAHWNALAVEKEKPLIKRIISFKYIIPNHLMIRLSFLKNTKKQSSHFPSIITHYTIKESEHKPLVHNNFQIGRFKVFVSPYESLSVPQKDVGIFVDDYNKWERNRYKNVTFGSGRIFHAFHFTNRDFRKKLKYKSSPIVEVMDIHCAYFTFFIHIFRTIPSIDKDELKRYEELVRNGFIYEDAMEFIHCDDRDAMKHMLNSYKALPPRRMGKRPENSYFKEKFPTIHKCLAHYPTYINKNGKEVKAIQKDATFIEAVIISEVCFELLGLGVTPFSLHDAIYLNQKDINKLKEMDNDIYSIFWRVFDSLTIEDVKEILSESEKYSQEKPCA